MDSRQEIRDFLVSRRAKISPAQAELTIYGGNRRVAGLRREEVAMIAGVSADYYTKLERGNLAGVSDSVLQAVAGALQLDDAERAPLQNLASAARATTSGRPSASRRAGVRPGVQRLLDAIGESPAYARNARFDVVAVNSLGRALFSDALNGAPSFNLARYLFLTQGSHDFFLDWETVARDCVSSLRLEAGRTPYDKAMTDLIGELVTRSPEFSSWWASQDVKLHRTATKRIQHHLVGELEVTGEAMELAGDGLRIIIYTVEPGSSSEQAMHFLSSWNGRRPDDVVLPVTENGD